MRKTLCEKCDNKNCSASGTYVYHMDGIENTCASFISKETREKETREKEEKIIEDIKEKLKNFKFPFFKVSKTTL